MGRFVAGICLLVALGCGYRFVAYGDSLGDVRSVRVETLRNDTYEPGVELVVSDALRREFLRRGADARAGGAAADVVLGGRVESLETEGRSFSSVVFTLEYELVLGLDLEARGPDGSEIPLGRASLRESERYLASPDVEATRKNREEAIRRVASLLAERVADALGEALSR